MKLKRLLKSATLVCLVAVLSVAMVACGNNNGSQNRPNIDDFSFENVYRVTTTSDLFEDKNETGRSFFIVEEAIDFELTALAAASARPVDGPEFAVTGGEPWAVFNVDAAGLTLTRGGSNAATLGSLTVLEMASLALNAGADDDATVLTHYRFGMEYDSGWTYADDMENLYWYVTAAQITAAQARVYTHMNATGFNFFTEDQAVFTAVGNAFLADAGEFGGQMRNNAWAIARGQSTLVASEVAAEFVSLRDELISAIEARNAHIVAAGFNLARPTQNYNRTRTATNTTASVETYGRRANALPSAATLNIEVETGVPTDETIDAFLVRLAAHTTALATLRDLDTAAAELANTLATFAADNGVPTAQQNFNTAGSAATGLITRPSATGANAIHGNPIITLPASFSVLTPSTSAAVANWFAPSTAQVTAGLINYNLRPLSDAQIEGITVRFGLGGATVNNPYRDAVDAVETAASNAGIVYAELAGLRAFIDTVREFVVAPAGITALEYAEANWDALWALPGMTATYIVNNPDGTATANARIVTADNFGPGETTVAQPARFGTSAFNALSTRANAIVDFFALPVANEANIAANVEVRHNEMRTLAQFIEETGSFSATELADMTSVQLLINLQLQAMNFNRVDSVEVTAGNISEFPGSTIGDLVDVTVANGRWTDAAEILEVFLTNVETQEIGERVDRNLSVNVRNNGTRLELTYNRALGEDVIGSTTVVSATGQATVTRVIDIVTMQDQIVVDGAENNVDFMTGAIQIMRVDGQIRGVVIPVLTETGTVETITIIAHEALLA
jgi:hypothetical protein